jgi:hypothetical protein
MGVFDFILALYSIIAGLAISVLVKGIAGMNGHPNWHITCLHCSTGGALHGKQLSAGGMRATVN